MEIPDDRLMANHHDQLVTESASAGLIGLSVENFYALIAFIDSDIFTHRDAPILIYTRKYL